MKALIEKWDQRIHEANMFGNKDLYSLAEQAFKELEQRFETINKRLEDELDKIANKKYLDDPFYQGEKIGKRTGLQLALERINE